jgi:hypothetical protein
LCGALGAFCFLMLVLFPYYKPSAAKQGEDHGEKNLEQMEKNMKDLQRQLEQFQNLDPQASKDFVKKMQDQLQQAQDQLNQARNRMNSAEQELERERAEKEQLQKRNDELEMRNPIGVQILWSSRHDIDLFIQQPFRLKDTKQIPQFEPDKKQGPMFSGDSATEVKAGPGSEVWILRDVPPAEYKVYYKLFDLKGDQNSATVNGAYLYNSQFNLLPPVELGPNRRQAFVGMLVMDPSAKLTFRPGEVKPQTPPQSGPGQGPQ